MPAFTVAGTDPMWLAERVGQLGVEARAGCHCATPAHRALGLTPASCRLSFAVYTSTDDADRALDAVGRAVAGASAQLRRPPSAVRSARP